MKKNKKNEVKQSVKNSSDSNNKNNFWKSTGGNFLIWALIFITAITVVQFISKVDEPKEVTYSQFEKYLENGKIETAKIVGNEFFGTLKEPEIQYIGSSEIEIKRISTTLPLLINHRIDSIPKSTPSTKLENKLG